MIDGFALQIDWGWASVVVALCALAATRQLPEGTLQATRRWPRMFGGGWRVAAPVRLMGRWHLVGLPLLFTECVILEPSTGDGARAAVADRIPDVTGRISARIPLAVAQLTGLTSFLLVAFLLPIAVATHGLVGLIFAICVLANTTLIATVALAWAEWRLRAANGGSVRGFRVRLQSPFSVPYTAATLLDHALAPLGAAGAVRRLMPDASLLEWLRPHVHDQLAGVHRDDTPSVLREIVAGLADADRAAAVTRPARCQPGERYCPRCGSCYESGSEACADCPGAPVLA